MRSYEIFTFIYSSDNLTNWFPKGIGCRVTDKFALFQGF